MDEQHQLPSKPKRGFAAMSTEQRKQVASKGGKAAHQKGTAHQFNAASGKLAGKKGGKTVSNDREHMAKIGVLGGQARSQQLGQAKYHKLIEIGNKKLDEKDAGNA